MNRDSIKQTAYFVAAMLIVMVSACGDKADENRNNDAKPALEAEGYKVVPQPFNSNVTLTAELLPGEQVTLRAAISGQLLEVYFKEGQKVRKGESLFRLDDRAWKAQMPGVKAALDAAQNEYDRKSNLLSVGGSSQEEVDHALSTLETLKSQWQQILLNIDLANVNAPFSGQLGMRNFSVGAFLNTGDPVTTLTELENMKVDFTLAQSYANSLSVGDSIEVMIGKDTLQASVYAMSPVIDPQSRTINVRALLPQKKDRIIMPGSYAEVRITANAVDSALLIPTQAVVPEINDQTVYLYKNGKAVRRKIQTGHRTPAMIHVVDGLSAGDTVLTTGLLGVKEGMDITLQSTR